jgi:hypothetical protein
MAPNAGTQERNAGDQKYASSIDPPLRTAGRAASKGKPQRSAAENFGIDESNLETRRQFIRLGEEERRLLTGMISWARSIAPQIAKEFYDWQFGFGPPLKSKVRVLQRPKRNAEEREK